MKSSILPYHAIEIAKKKFNMYWQNEEESNATHLKNFKNIVKVIEYFSEEAFKCEPWLIKYEKEQDQKKGIADGKIHY